MIPEQVWDGDAIDAYDLQPGRPSGSAAPLVWAHAELIKIVAALHNGRAVEQLGCMSPGSEQTVNSTDRDKLRAARARDRMNHG